MTNRSTPNNADQGDQGDATPVAGIPRPVTAVALIDLVTGVDPDAVDAVALTIATHDAVRDVPEDDRSDLVALVAATDADPTATAVVIGAILTAPVTDPVVIAARSAIDTALDTAAMIAASVAEHHDTSLTADDMAAALASAITRATPMAAGDLATLVAPEPAARVSTRGAGTRTDYASTREWRHDAVDVSAVGPWTCRGRTANSPVGLVPAGSIEITVDDQGEMSGIPTFRAIPDASTGRAPREFTGANQASDALRWADMFTDRTASRRQSGDHHGSPFGDPQRNGRGGIYRLDDHGNVVTLFTATLGRPAVSS